MADTSIQWTDAVWNPVTGCSKVSPGCAHCYAEGVAKRFWPTQYRPVLAASGASLDTISTSHHEDYLANGFARPRQFTDVQCHEDRLEQPLHWRKPRKVFVNSMSDLFHESVPDAFIDRVFAVMALAPRHTFQVLTKRAGRMRHYFAPRGSYTEQWYQRVFALIIRGRDAGTWEMPTGYAEQWALGQSHGALTCGSHESRFLPNVWLGASVENQHFADERIPLLLVTPAAVRFISAEPLLGDVNLRPWLVWQSLECDQPDLCDHFIRGCHNRKTIAPLSWVIVGGESGAGARPFDEQWARSIVEQCRAASVPVFVKQLGSVPMVSEEAWRARIGDGRPGFLLEPGNLLSHTNHKRVPAGFVPLKFDDRSGGDMAEWPEDLRVRQFPEVA